MTWKFEPLAQLFIEPLFEQISDNVSRHFLTRFFLMTRKICLLCQRVGWDGRREEGGGLFFFFRLSPFWVFWHPSLLG